jgi:hypothetical protein
MRRYIIVLAVILACALLPSMFNAANSGVTALNAHAAADYGKLPLAFIENGGQLNDGIRYVIHDSSASAFFRNDGVTFDLCDALADRTTQTHVVLKLAFEGADPDCRAEGVNELPGKVNYLTGNDRSKWHTNVPTFMGIVYKNVWPGIDVIYRGDRHQLKYDIRINP